MALQCMENELLKLDIYVPVNPEDYDEEHLVEMGSTLNTESAEIHKVAHIQAMIAKGVAPAAQMDWQAQGNENAMANSMQSMGMAQAGSELQTA